MKLLYSLCIRFKLIQTFWLIKKSTFSHRDVSNLFKAFLVIFFIFNLLFIFMIIDFIFIIIIIIFYIWVLTWNTLKIYKNTSFWTSFVFKSLSFWLLNKYKPYIQNMFFLSYFCNFAVLFFIFTINNLLFLFL